MAPCPSPSILLLSSRTMVGAIYSIDKLVTGAFPVCVKALRAGNV